MDFYIDMTQLYAVEPTDGYARRIRTIDQPRRMVVAPHGGSLETGTSEIALGVAGGVYDIEAPWTYFVFDSLRPAGLNGIMHVTATAYDDPALDILLIKMDTAVVIHGCPDTQSSQPTGSQIAWVGGLDLVRRDAVIAALNVAGIDARIATGGIAGTDPANLCNRTSENEGVQIELTKTLRSACFSDNTLAGRSTSQTPLFWALVGAVRFGMN